MSNILRCKGRFITQKQLLKKEKCKKATIRRWQEKRNLTLNERGDVSNLCVGKRIVDLSILGKNLKCNNCNSILSLEKIVDEKKKGLQSVLKIQCEKCYMLTLVDTGGSHNVNSKAKTYLIDQKHNDITTNAVLGIYYFYFYRVIIIIFMKNTRIIISL